MSPSPSDRKELGLLVDSSDLAAAFSPAVGSGTNKMKDELEEDEDGEGQDLWAVPVDTSLRIGDPTNIDGLFSHQPSSDATRARPTANVDNFFGLMPARSTLGQLRGTSPQQTQTQTQMQMQTADQSQSQRYTPYAPFRFGVEFWGLDTLKEKVRLHSHTVWYAGSLWNVYTQAVRKKGGGVQVGVYLHRQSSVDSLPGVSAPRQDHHQHQQTNSTIVAPIPIPLSSVMFQSPAPAPAHAPAQAQAPRSMSPSTSAGASANTGRGRAQSEGGSRLSGSRSMIWRTTTPVLIAPRLSSPSTVSVLAHPTSSITSPSSISVVATNPSGPSSGAYSHSYSYSYALARPELAFPGSEKEDRGRRKPGDRSIWVGTDYLIRSYDSPGSRASAAIPRPPCTDFSVFHDCVSLWDWEQSDTVLECA